MQSTIDTNLKSCIITFTNTAKKNALSLDVLEQLSALLDKCATDTTIHSIILTGANDDKQVGASKGNNFFSAGSNLSFFNEYSNLTNNNNLREHQQQQLVQGFNKAATIANNFIISLVSFPKPIIAAVNGHALGLGALLLLHCDFVYMVHYATFLTPFSLIGIHAEGGSSLLYPWAMGRAFASQPMFAAKQLQAKELLKLRMVNSLFDSEQQVLEAAKATAAQVAKITCDTLIENKRLVMEGIYGGSAHVAQVCRRESEALKKGGMDTVALFLRYNAKLKQRRDAMKTNNGETINSKL